MKKSNLRQNELDCLNKIKDSFIYFKGIKKVFDNSDYSTMELILNSAHQNEKHSDFPDFFFDGGIIEHFEVTASDETRKGSQYKVENAYCQRDLEQHYDQLNKDFLDSPHNPGTIKVETIEDTHTCFSYESFVNSLKRNIKHHLESLRKSKYPNQVVVFLIEQQDARLCVYAHDVFDRFYKLSEDKQLLQYIKETLVDVNYIIFNTTDAYEVIDLSKIDLMIARAKENLDIRGGRQKNVSIKLYIDL